MNDIDKRLARLEKEVGEARRIFDWTRRQNTRALDRLAAIDSNHKHYLRKRQDLTKPMFREFKTLRREYDRLREEVRTFLHTTHLTRSSKKTGEKRYVVALTQNEIQKLIRMVEEHGIRFNAYLDKREGDS